MNVIQTTHLTHRYGTTHSITDLNIEVPAGMIYGFLGPNGSGKTTTIRLLLGLLDPLAGRAEVLGFDPVHQGDEIRRRSGALLEHTGLYERLSAEENLDFYGQVWKISPRERRQRIEELLTGLGLWERRKEACGSWSRGMKQKLAIARALLHRPELVFLDEPTAGLDPVAAAALHQDLLELVKTQGVTVFLTTHNLAEAEKLCARVAVIQKGELLMSGSPQELRLNQGRRLEIAGEGFTPELLERLRGRIEVASLELGDRHLTLFLNGELETAPLVNLLVQAGVQIDEVRKGKASLEEAFLDILNQEAHP
jgi:ABC-2 type transport system ATP-binding protein